MEPYQAWRRGLISYTTYLEKQLCLEINTDASVDLPADAGDFGFTCASDMTVSGAITIATDDIGFLVAYTGSLTIADGGSLIIT